MSSKKLVTHYRNQNTFVATYCNIFFPSQGISMADAKRWGAGEAQGSLWHSPDQGGLGPEERMAGGQETRSEGEASHEDML